MIHKLRDFTRCASMLAFVAAAVLAQQPSPAVAAPAAPAIAAPAVNGRVEDHDGLRVLRTWGTPQERGFAHGTLLATAIVASMQSEFAARFGKRAVVLDQLRKALPRLIEYPEDQRQELAAMFDGVVKSGVDRAIPGLDRAFDLDDLLVANALDVFGLMGCSGFAVYGDKVDGGGVLSGRNFDWPFTGPHLLENTIVHVQHLADGRAIASVTWPGYLGTVTGIDEEGVAVYLHVGSGRVTLMPEAGSWPTAIAANEILRAANGTDATQVWRMAQEMLEHTSPPAGFLTRVILPTVPAEGSPAGLFETDSRKCVRAAIDGPCVVTNHFQGRDDGREAMDDSLQRQKSIRTDIDHCLADGDHKVSIEEGWAMLTAVQRGGKRFGTLHSLVFRQAPWCFELRLAEWQGGKVIAAPSSQRRFALSREELFVADPTKAPAAGK